ncbi:MAG TPA: hypothetical protein VGH66_01300 [Acidimicrobiales bacterium]
MIAIVCIEAVAIVLLAILVAGLLRSHAEILRALHGLGVDVDWATRGGAAATAGMGVTTDVVLGPGPAGPRPAGDGSTGRDIVGTDPSGGAVRVAVLGARQDTLVAFLSTGCSTCRTFWDTFRTSSQGAVPGNARLVVVTRGPEAESPGLVRDLAPPDIAVVLSTEAWEAYDVPVAPYFTLVEGATGHILGEGAGTSWAQVSSLLTQALGDAPQVRAPRRPPSTDRAREARADDELLSAGIGPGDPRLYPTQLDAERGQDRPR